MYQTSPNDADRDPWWDDPYELGAGSENHGPDGSWIKAELVWGEMPSDAQGLVRHNADGTFYPGDAFAVRICGNASERYKSSIRDWYRRVQVTSGIIAETRDIDAGGPLTAGGSFDDVYIFDIIEGASPRVHAFRCTLILHKVRLFINAWEGKIGGRTLNSSSSREVEVTVTGDSWEETGTTILELEVDDGIYTISFGSFEGLGTPSPITVGLRAGGDYRIHAIYGEDPHVEYGADGDVPDDPSTFVPAIPITSALKIVVVPYSPRFAVFPYLWLKWGNPGESFYSKPYVVLVRYDGNAYDPDNAEKLSLDQRALVNFVEWNGTATRVKVDENGNPEVWENGEPKTESLDVAYRWKDPYTERTSFHLRLYDSVTDNPYKTPQFWEMLGKEHEPTEGEYEVRDTEGYVGLVKPGEVALTVWTEPENGLEFRVEGPAPWYLIRQHVPTPETIVNSSPGTWHVKFQSDLEGYLKPPDIDIVLEGGHKKTVIGRYVKKLSYHARSAVAAFDPLVVFGSEHRYHKFVVRPDSDKMAELQDENYLMVNFAISFCWFPNVRVYGNYVSWNMEEDYERRKQTLATDISYYPLGNTNPISMRAVRLTEDARNKVDAWKRSHGHGSAAEENENAEENIGGIDIAEILFDDGSWEVDGSIRVGATFSPLFRLEEVMENLENAGVGTELLGEMLDNLFGRIQEFFGESTESLEFPEVGGVAVVSLDEHMFEIYKQDTMVENEPDQRFEGQGSFEGELVRYEGNLFILRLTAENEDSKAEVTQAIQILFDPSKPLRLHANLSGEGMIIRRVRDWGWKADFEVLALPQAGGLWAARVYDNQGFLLFERGAQPATSFLSSEPEVGFSGTYEFSWWKYPDSPTEVVVEATNVWGASAVQEFVVSPYVPRKLWWVQEAIKWLLFIVLAMMVWNIGVYLTRTGRLQRLPTPFEG